MSSVVKALEMLSHFSEERPEIGLSNLCRMAKRDKATTYRHLQALEASGFIEKNLITRQYRLGPALLHLASIREKTVPRKTGVDGPLRTLADATGETAHASVLSGTTLFSLASCESPRHSTRAIVDLQVHPLHATASGLCTLAFGPAELLQNTLPNLHPFTAQTPATQEKLLSAISKARSDGLGVSSRGYEDDIIGIAAPLFDQTGAFAGTIAVAGVATRMSPEFQNVIRPHLITAARAITRNWGGSIPADLEKRWEKCLSSTQQMEALK